MQSTYLKFQNRVTFFFLILILLIGGGLRLYRLDYGLPFLYDPDEPVFVNSALGMLRDKDANPHFFGHPATTTIYTLAATYAGIYVSGRVLGQFNQISDFVEMYRVDPSILYYSGRLITALYGIATIILVFLIARRMFNKRTAFIAALVVAISPVHVQYSQLIRTDIQVGFFLLVAFWYCLNIVNKGTWRDYILSGIFLGFAFTTKYPAIIFSPSILLAHLFARHSNKREHWKLVTSGFAFLVAVFVSSPYLFIDYQSALSDIFLEAGSTHLGATGQGMVENLLWYINIALPEAITILGTILAGFGIMVCILSKKHIRALFVVFPLALMLFLSSLNLRWVRWIVPTIPFFCILCAVAIDQFANWITQRFHRRAGNLTAIVMTLLILVPIVLIDAGQIKEAAGTDTRTQARQWIMSNIPSQSKLLMELYSPQLPKDQYQYFYVVNTGEIVKIDPSIVMSLTYRPIPGWSDRFAYLKSVDDIREQGIEYIVMSDFYDRYLAEKNVYFTELKNYDEIMSLGTLIYEIEPVKNVNRGPKLRIYQLSAHE